MVISHQKQKQSQKVVINIDRRKRKGKKRPKRKEAVRAPLLGTGNTFQRLPANPFMEGMMNMVSSMNQQMSNNFRSSLSDIRAENSLLMEKLITEQRNKEIAQQNNDTLRIQELNEKIDIIAQEMEKRSYAEKQWEDLMAEQTAKETKGKEEEEEEEEEVKQIIKERQQFMGRYEMPHRKHTAYTKALADKAEEQRSKRALEQIKALELEGKREKQPARKL